MHDGRGHAHALAIALRELAAEAASDVGHVAARQRTIDRRNALAARHAVELGAEADELVHRQVGLHRAFLGQVPHRPSRGRGIGVHGHAGHGDRPLVRGHRPDDHPDGR